MPRYYDCDDDAEDYNDQKNYESRTAACVECGMIISASGSNCIEFGIYMCPICRNNTDYE